VKARNSSMSEPVQAGTNSIRANLPVRIRRPGTTSDQGQSSAEPYPSVSWELPLIERSPQFRCSLQLRPNAIMPMTQNSRKDKLIVNCAQSDLIALRDRKRRIRIILLEEETADSR